MTKIFLKAKHWQLFLVIFAIPLIFQFIILAMIISETIVNRNIDPTVFVNYGKIYMLFWLVIMSIFFGWFWSVATHLQSKIPTNVKMKLKQFKIFFFIPLVYFLVLIFFMASVFNELIVNNLEPNVAFVGAFVGIIIPLHLFSIFCIFHSIYFTAKTIKTVELQREVKFGDFVGEFFMIWFLFIGLWILQPKINKMAAGTVEKENDFEI